MNTEHPLSENAANEALAVSCVSPTASLNDALNAATHQQEVHAVHVGLSADKRLVGALDSACNRRVTGSDWLRNFLSGDGGTQVGYKH